MVVLIIDGARGWRHDARLVAAAVAFPVAYQVFRMAYYGVLVPNTALAKEAGRTELVSLGVGDLVRNVLRAPSLTALRISGDPAQDARTLCR